MHTDLERSGQLLTLGKSHGMTQVDNVAGKSMPRAETNIIDHAHRLYFFTLSYQQKPC